MRLCLRHAALIDGTGAPARLCDVLIQGDRIVKIGELSNEPSDANFDCEGLTLTPGFIDVHTHDDAQVLRSPNMLAKLSQGVTTVITGNCGLSLVPLVTQKPIPPLDLLHGSEFRFSTLTAYAHAVSSVKPHVNVAALIGHTSLRAAVMQNLDREATQDEISQMSAHLTDALASGALGLSSGLFYQPAQAATAHEMKALVRVLGKYAGVYVTHLRSEMDGIIEAMHEAADTALSARVPWVLSHHKCAGPRNWGKTIETLALLERLSQQQELALDAYPYSAGSTLLREDLVDGVIRILITRSDPHPEMVGRYLEDIAKEWCVDQLGACQRLMPAGACYFQMHEDDVRRVLAHPLTMIGSDGLPHDDRPHPRLWGAFARVLGHYSRDEGLFSFAQAIHKMTGLSARRFGLSQRGIVSEGAFADLVLLDPLRIKDKATYEQPKQMCEGIHRVMVNGQWAFESRKAVGQGQGRFLRKN